MVLVSHSWFSHAHRQIAACLAVIMMTALPLTSQGDTISLTPDKIEVIGGTAQAATHRGHACIRLVPQEVTGDDTLGLLKGLTLNDGEIEVEVAGSPAQGASGAARGFIGISFHVQEDRKHLETIYLRPTNGRADDQLRRNHSVQYVSHPDWPWERLRQESPGLYETYVDLEPGVWTHMRIVIQGTNATLYVGSAPQPILLVHDLKLGAVGGGIGLWIGPGTEGYFRDLKVTPGK